MNEGREKQQKNRTFSAKEFDNVFLSFVSFCFSFLFHHFISINFSNHLCAWCGSSMLLSQSHTRSKGERNSVTVVDKPFSLTLTYAKWNPITVANINSVCSSSKTTLKSTINMQHAVYPMMDSPYFFLFFCCLHICLVSFCLLTKRVSNQHTHKIHF